MALWGSFAFKPAQLFIPLWFRCGVSGSPGLHTANHGGEPRRRARGASEALSRWVNQLLGVMRAGTDPEPTHQERWSRIRCSNKRQPPPKTGCRSLLEVMLPRLPSESRWSDEAGRFGAVYQQEMQHLPENSAR